MNLDETPKKTKPRLWKVEAVQRRNDEDIDWYEGEPGPGMRGLISRWLNCDAATVQLRVVQLGTGILKIARVVAEGYQSRKRYVATYQGEHLTLEGAVRKMKKDLKEGR